MKSRPEAKKIISSDGNSIYYWTNYINGQNKDIVFLHPASSMNSSSLEDMEKMLNDIGHSTIVLDPRGTGLSQVPARKKYFQKQRYVDDIFRIIDAENAVDATFFGHSAGFMPIAGYVAETQNANALFGTSVSYKFSETIGDGSMKKLAFHLFNRLGRYTEYPVSVGVRTFKPFQKKEKNDQSALVGYSEGAVFEAIVNAPFSQIHQNIVSGIEINKWDITEDLRKIRVPMTLIYGKQNNIVVPGTGERIKKDLEKHNPKVYVINIDGKLSMPVTDPSKVVEVMKTYHAIERK